MSTGVCITTRHRPELLEETLQRLQRSTRQPLHIVVSDDSSNPEMIERTRAVVARYPNALYVAGPHRGVCANRNNAVAHLRDVDYVAFLDDDGFVTPEYLQVAQEVYDAMPPEQRERTILTGTRIDVPHKRIETRAKLDFRCYFAPSERAEIAGASYAVYPRSFLDRHPWDERIFFGLEDAELSLRARADGYTIEFIPHMIVFDAAQGQSTVLQEPGRVTAYAFNGEAARLYLGVKRYKDIEPNYMKLGLFVPLFFAQITYSLAIRRSLNRLPELVRRSNVASLFRRPAP
jgi:GT2 family glycosyltransferase